MVTIYTEPGHKLLVRLIQHRVEDDISRNKFAIEYEGHYEGHYDPNINPDRSLDQRLEKMYRAVEKAMGEPKEAFPEGIPRETFDELLEEWRDYDFSDVRDVKVSL